MVKKNFAKRAFLPMCLAMSLALLGGCSYSASSTTETSVGVDVNGKPQVNASASMNVERSADGKTANQKTSVSWNSQTGANASQEWTKASAKDGVQFIVENVVLRKGETEISGYFTKDGGSAIQMKDVTLSFSATEGNKVIWSDEGLFGNVNIPVRPGERTPHTFIVENPGAPAYNGPFHFEYNLTY